MGNNGSTKADADGSEPPLDGGKHKQQHHKSNTQFSIGNNNGSDVVVNNSSANASGGSNNSLKVQSQTQTMTRSASGADVTEKYLTQLVPVERLAEILKEQTSAKCNVNGIVSDVFVVSNWSVFQLPDNSFPASPIE